jgi:hypothetical protein
MKKIYLFLFLFLISCGGYFDESYLDDYEAALRNLNVSEEFVAQAKDEAKELCDNFYYSINTFFEFGDTFEANYIQGSAYTNARYAGAGPQGAYALYLAVSNMCSLDEYIYDGCPGCYIDKSIEGLESMYQMGY